MCKNAEVLSDSEYLRCDITSVRASWTLRMGESFDVISSYQQRFPFVQKVLELIFPFILAIIQRAGM